MCYSPYDRDSLVHLKRGFFGQKVCLLGTSLLATNARWWCISASLLRIQFFKMCITHVVSATQDSKWSALGVLWNLTGYQQEHTTKKRSLLLSQVKAESDRCSSVQTWIRCHQGITSGRETQALALRTPTHSKCELGTDRSFICSWKMVGWDPVLHWEMKGSRR